MGGGQLSAFKIAYIMGASHSQPCRKMHLSRTQPIVWEHLQYLDGPSKPPQFLIHVQDGCHPSMPRGHISGMKSGEHRQEYAEIEYEGVENKPSEKRRDGEGPSQKQQGEYSKSKYQGDGYGPSEKQRKGQEPSQTQREGEKLPVKQLKLEQQRNERGAKDQGECMARTRTYVVHDEKGNVVATVSYNEKPRKGRKDSDSDYTYTYSDYPYSDYGYFGYSDYPYSDFLYTDYSCSEQGYSAHGYSDLGFSDHGYSDCAYSDYICSDYYSDYPPSEEKTPPSKKKDQGGGGQDGARGKDVSASSCKSGKLCKKNEKPQGDQGKGYAKCVAIDKASQCCGLSASVLREMIASMTGVGGGGECQCNQKGAPAPPLVYVCTSTAPEQPMHAFQAFPHPPHFPPQPEAFPQPGMFPQPGGLSQPVGFPQFPTVGPFSQPLVFGPQQLPAQPYPSSQPTCAMTSANRGSLPPLVAYQLQPQPFPPIRPSGLQKAAMRQKKKTTCCGCDA